MRVWEFRIKCSGCGNEFKTRHQSQRYCSNSCKSKKEREKHVPLYRKIGSNNRGAVSELMASSDLLERGFEVFRAISPSCSCDLIALKSGTSLRIEVRTARIGRNGRVTYPKNKSTGRAEIYAAVMGQKVLYFSVETGLEHEF